MSREIDALVAKHVMGLETSHSDDIYMNDINPIPNYSTDIAAAWEVVEQLYTENFCLDRVEWDYRCNFGLIDEYPTWALSYTAPMAICIAALKAKGITYD